MRTKIRKVKETANELYKAIRELEIEIDDYLILIRSITRNVKEIYKDDKR